MDRVNEYDTGGVANDSETPFSEGTNLLSGLLGVNDPSLTLYGLGRLPRSDRSPIVGGSHGTDGTGVWNGDSERFWTWR